MELPLIEQLVQKNTEQDTKIGNIEAKINKPERTEITNVKVAGWYRIAQISGSSNQATALNLVIGTRYNYNPPCSVTVNITTTFKKAIISQIGAILNNSSSKGITKLRVQWNDTGKAFYVDVYYTQTGENNISVANCSLIDTNSTAKWELLTPILVTEEYTTVDEYTFDFGQIGEEVSTNEWRLGKRVHKKIIDCGNLPNKTSKSVSIGFDSNTVNITKIEGVANVEGSIKYQLPYISQMGDNNVGLYINSWYIWIFTTGDRSTNTAVATIYYTKN